MIAAPNNHVPHSADAEKATLSAMIRDNAQIPAVLRLVSPEDFYGSGNIEICRAIADRAMAGKGVDPILLEEHLRGNAKVPDGYLLDVLGSAPVVTNGKFYAEIVRADAVRRRLIASATASAQGAQDPGVEIESLLAAADRVLQEQARRMDDAAPLSTEELVRQVLGEWETSRGESETPGLVRTGYRDLDDLVLGFQPGQLVIVAGRPGMGKSTICYNFMSRQFDAGLPSLILSYEVEASAIMGSILLSRARVSGEAIRKRRVSAEEMERIVAMAAKVAEEKKIHVVAPRRFGLIEAIATIRDYKTRFDIKVAYVDYLQMLDCRETGMRGSRNAENRQQEVTLISRRFKELARDLGIPIVAICQLHRGPENREDKRPTLSDLRESGSLEQDADLVLMLYRDEYYNENSTHKGTCEVLIRKQRSGRTGAVQLATNFDCMRFDDLARAPMQEVPVDDGDWRNR
jgi:replicative DNA helicase